jgi:hypothetical protein
MILSMSLSETLKSPTLNKIFHGLNALCVIAFVFSLTHYIMNLDNTLEEHGLWDSEKMHLDYRVPGAENFFKSRETLKGSQLRLGEWGGFQQLTFRSGNLYVPLGMDLLLLPWGDFSLFLSATTNGFQGFRLSRHPAIPSGLFEVDRKGRFTFFEQTKTKFDFKEDQVRLHYEEGHLVVGNSIVSLPEHFKTNGFNFLGFRSGGKQAIVSDMAMGISPIFKIKFDFLYDFWAYAVGLSIFFISIYLAVQINFRFAPVNVFYVLFSLALMTFVLDAYDSKTQIAPYPYFNQPIEYSNQTPAGENVVELIGKNMIFGEGAHHEKDAFYELLKSNSRLKDKTFHLVYRKNFKENAYQKVFFLGPEDSEEQLKSFMESGDANSVFVFKPHPYKWDNEKMNIFSKMISENGFQLINAHQYLWQRRATGFLYWSESSLTSWGQELLAEIVEEGLRVTHD